MNPKFNSELPSPLASRSRTLWLLASIAVSIAWGWHPLVDALRLALASEAHTHILLILPLAGALVLMQRGAPPVAAESRAVAGYVLLLVALLLGAFAKWGHFGSLDDVPLSISMFALVTWWIGSLMACYGISATRAYLFPLLFLYWLVPIPGFAIDKIIPGLQILSAYAARLLLVVGRIPVTQDGTLLSMPGFDVDVAPQCSSIRSSLMLLITTMVLAHLFLRSWLRKAMLIAAAIPLAALKNGLRIFTLVEIGTRDPQIFDSDLHHRGGIVFFLISVAMIVLLIWILRRTERVSQAMPEVATRVS